MAIRTTSDALSAMAERRVLPVVTVQNADELHSVADALTDGGLPVIELTLRTGYALQGIRDAADRGDLLVGAGSIRSVDDAKAAVAAGAQFLVSPGFNPGVVAWSIASGVEFYPGVVTPTEVLAARALGIATVKFFPASVFGGPAWLRAVSAPIPDIGFIPTGGIDDATFETYLATPGVVAVGGSWFLSGGAERIADVVARASAIPGTPAGVRS